MLNIKHKCRGVRSEDWRRIYKFHQYINDVHEWQDSVEVLAMIYKFGGVACATGATVSIKGLIRSADWWDTSMGWKGTIIHITRAWAPKVLGETMFLHALALNFEPFRWLIHRNYKRRLGTTSKTTSALLQIRFITIHMISVSA